MSTMMGKDSSGAQRAAKMLTDGTLYVLSTLSAAMDTVNNWLKIQIADRLFEAIAPTTGTSVSTAGETILDSVECGSWSNLALYVYNAGAVALNHVYVDVSPDSTRWVNLIDYTTAVAASTLWTPTGSDLDDLKQCCYRYVRMRASTAASTTTVDAYLHRSK